MADVFFAYVRKSDDFVESIQIATAVPPDDATFEYMEITPALFQEIRQKKIKHLTGTEPFRWKKTAPNTITEQADTRRSLEVTMKVGGTPVTEADVGDSVTFDFRLLDKDGALDPIPGTLTRRFGFVRDGEPMRRVNISVTNGVGSRTKTFNQSGRYQLISLVNVKLTGTFEFEIIEDF